MSGLKYSTGDLVVLKADLTRLKANPRICRIMNALPSDTGETYYQVRFTHESFERRISGLEIEKLYIDPVADGRRQPSGVSQPWLTPLAKERRK